VLNRLPHAARSVHQSVTCPNRAAASSIRSAGSSIRASASSPRSIASSIHATAYATCGDASFSHSNRSASLVIALSLRRRESSCRKGALFIASPWIYVRRAQEFRCEISQCRRDESCDRLLDQVSHSDICMTPIARPVGSVGGIMTKAPRTQRAEIIRQIGGARAHESRERKRGRRAMSAAYDPRAGRVMVELTSGFVFGFPAHAIPELAKVSADVLGP
jgi:hypothetical protein